MCYQRIGDRCLEGCVELSDEKMCSTGNEEHWCPFASFRTSLSEPRPRIHTITRLTSETALREMSHQYMRPIMSAMIMLMVTRMMNDEVRLKVKSNVTANTEAREMVRLTPVSAHMVRYCS